MIANSYVQSQVGKVPRCSFVIQTSLIFTVSRSDGTVPLLAICEAYQRRGKNYRYCLAMEDYEYRDELRTRADIIIAVITD